MSLGVAFQGPFGLFSFGSQLRRPFEDEIRRQACAPAML